MAILTEALEKINASLSTAAQVYVKAGIAQNDATIICFRAKYADPRMRPVTMISAVLLREVIPLLMRRHLNVKSRFYGGIHYLPSIEKSHQYGISIGDDAANLQLIK